MRPIFLIYILIAAFNPAYTQHHYTPWGKIPEADLKMQFYPQDSAAGAVVLQDVGNIVLTEFRTDDWVVNYTYWRRLKIFNPAAFDEGNLAITYYADKSIEKMKDLEVQVTFPNGTTKTIRSDDIFSEQPNADWKVKKIFIPGLEKGCIIEYRYKLTRSYISMLYDWSFQDNIPVRWSEVNVDIPDFMEYALLLQNLDSFDLNQRDEPIKRRTFGGWQYYGKVFRLGMANLPALQSEPFVAALDDYKKGVRFQKGYTATLEDTEFAEMTWKSFAVDMDRLTLFGEQYTNLEHIRPIWTSFSQQVEGDSAKVIIEKARRYVAETIKWNEEFSRFVSQPLEKVFLAKEGNSAEVNLTLVALLRGAGLDAYPILISTSDNGRVQLKYPFWRQFNSVIAGVRQNGKTILLDATDTFLPFGQIHTQHYNHHGWLVDQVRPEWITISPPEASMVWLANMKLDEAGIMKGNLSIQMDNEIATDVRGSVSESYIRKNVLTGYEDYSIDSLVFVDKDDLNKPLRAKMNLVLNDGADVTDDYIYVKPVLDFLFTENPFKSDKRTFPVNFSYPMKANYIINLEIPENYSLDELPKKERIALPDDLGSISFSCTKDQQNGKMIQITLRMQIKTIDFGPEYYDVLRTFFNLMAEKTAMQLVLKKDK